MEKNKTILLVEDHDISARSLVRILEKREYFVFRCENGMEALDYIREGNKYDLAIVDSSLSNSIVQGGEIMMESKIKNPSAPVISFSAYNHRPDNGNYIVMPKSMLIDSANKEKFLKFLDDLLR